MRRALLIAGGLGVAALAAAAAWRSSSSANDGEDVGDVGQDQDLFGQVTDLLSPATVAEGQLSEPNVGAFLAMIRAAEGTASADGYRALFGYTPAKGGPLFTTFNDHPRVKTYGEFIEAGKQTFTTAAGAYQITASTFDRLKGKLAISDFTPSSQDLIALELIREKGALELVQAGRFDDAVAKVAAVWASLPGGPYPQPARSIEFVHAKYEGAGGSYA